MRDCLIVSHVSDSCGRKAATGDKRLPALSSSHQVGPVGYHAIVLTLLPVQPLLYLARALPTHPLHGILFGFPCCFRILIVSLLPLASKVMTNIHHDSFLLRLIQLVFSYVLYSHRSLELIHRARRPARCFLALSGYQLRYLRVGPCSRGIRRSRSCVCNYVNTLKKAGSPNFWAEFQPFPRVEIPPLQ